VSEKIKPHFGYYSVYIQHQPKKPALSRRKLRSFIVMAAARGFTAPASQRISRCNLIGRDKLFLGRVLASYVFPSKISCQVQATLCVWKSLRHCTRRNPSSLLRLRQRGSFRVRFELVASSFLRYITEHPVALQVHLALAVRSQGQGPVLRFQVPVR
jgi:hypothetical protein